MKKLSRNQKFLIGFLIVPVLMVGLAYASVPLYRLFCQVTGFGGTTMKADAAPTLVTDKPVKVLFDTNVNGLDWTFKFEQPSQMTTVGATNMLHFTVKNNSDKPQTGRATYNVVPDVMGPYFMKLECFCFTDQTLQPGEERTFPVVYFLDPEMLKDSDTKGTTNVTMSYTFFESKNVAAVAAK